MSDALRALSTATITSRLAQPEPPRLLWGLFERRERWSLSWRGRLIATSALLLAGALLFEGVCPFLTVTHRVKAELLVVEGWIHEQAMRGAVEEFRRGSYKRVFATGGPVGGNGGYVNDYHTSACVGAELLEKCGVPSDLVQMVPSHEMDRDRTYASAVALREWFREHNMAVQSLNVVTESAHARRTRLMFKEALGKNVAVGIIAIANPDYDARHWWRYSEGIKDVSSEALAYIYARLFFHASDRSSRGQPTRISQAHR